MGRTAEGGEADGLALLPLVRAVLAEEGRISPEAVVPEAELEVLGLDSVRMTQVIFALEERLDITFPLEGEEVAPRTVADLVRLVARLEGGGG